MTQLHTSGSGGGFSSSASPVRVVSAHAAMRSSSALSAVSNSSLFSASARFSLCGHR